MSNLKTFPDLLGKNGIFRDGNWVESKDQDANGKIRLIQLADIGVGKFINKSSRYMNDQQARKLNCTFLEPGDILVARMPDPIGRACIFPENMQKCVTVVDICIIRVDPSFVDKNWLVHFINSQACNSQILKWITGTTRQRISRGNLSKIKIPLPPLAEQKRIAAILDKADAIRRKREEAIQLTDTLLKSVFLDMFGDPVTNPKGWEVKPLREIAKIQIGPFGTQLHKEDYITGGIPLINPKHIQNGSIINDSTVSIKNKKHSELKEYHLETGDIIMGRRGEMGRCAIISEREKGWMCGTGSLYIRPNNSSIFSEYLNNFLSSDQIKLYFEEQSLGATMPNLNKTIIGNLKTPVPSDIALSEYLDSKNKIHAIINNLCNSLSVTNSLLASLTQRAFRGELTASDLTQIETEIEAAE